jgi:ketosteroid isomerase-like protein
VSRCLLRFPPGALAFLLFVPSRAPAQKPTRADSAAVAEVRQAVRDYDAALRRGDAEAIERYWAPEYLFINPRGERLSRSDRQANARQRRTTFDSLAPVLKEGQIHAYGDWPCTPRS